MNQEVKALKLISSKRSSNRNKKRNLVAYTHPDSIITEQYRSIRTNIGFLVGKNGNKTILFTSPGVGEGKSTTVANLAVSLANQKQKVLIIDADLRKPSIQTIYKLENKLGLSSVLSERIELEKAIQNTEIDGLEILTSGPVPNNPAELLSSINFENLLEEVSESYDVILVDSPPVMEVTDTLLLANQCDSVVLVVRHKKTEFEDVVDAKKLLEFGKAKLIGTIINDKK